MTQWGHGQGTPRTVRVVDMTNFEPIPPVQAGLECCRRPMTSIEVSTPFAAGSSTLALHTCSVCGRHVWKREGQVLERDAVLAIVRDRVEAGPPPRAARPRVAHPSSARPVPSGS